MVPDDEVKEAAELVKIDLAPVNETFVACQVGVDCFDGHTVGCWYGPHYCRVTNESS